MPDLLCFSALVCKKKCHTNIIFDLFLANYCSGVL
jgi:hypothetical protein